LFSGYVDTLLKIKQESTGWPERYKTDEEREAFLKDYEAKEGIKLDPSNMVPNPGKRALSKLMLNSLWGKFGQRENLPKTEYITQQHQFINYLTSPDIIVKDLHLINDDLAMVEYTTTTDFTVPSGRTNVVIAAFTTACARIRLYKLLDILKEKVLYMDTDSVIFISSKDSHPLEHLVGDCLGYVTDEIVTAYGAGTYITEFVSGGPKNYGYTVNNGKDCWKVKGISQNYEVSQVMNYATILSLVTQGGAPVAITNHLITRNKKTCKLVNKDAPKTYRVVFDKAVVHPDWTTTPYGY
jgi:hypothetical protein